MAETQAEMIETARLAAAVRAQIASMKLGGVGAPPIPVIRPGLSTVNPLDGLAAERERTRQLAIRIFDEDDPDMAQVGAIVRKIRDRLSTPNFPTQISGPADPICTVRQFGGYVIGNRPPVHLCPGFFSNATDVIAGQLAIAPDEQRIRTMLHETAHLIGIGAPGGEAYYTAFDGCPVRGGGLGPNQADSWAHFIHALSGQPLDRAAASIGAGRPPAPPPAAPPAGPRLHTVVAGDYLGKLATKYYGNAALWNKIYAANRSTIGPNPNKLFPGQTLLIPT